MLLPPAYVVRQEGTVCTGVCLSTLEGGGTRSPSHNTSTGPTSFLGGTAVTVPRSLPRGVPQSQMGVPQNGVLPGQGWGTPSPQPEMGYAPWPEMGYPPARMMYPPPRDRTADGVLAA